MKSSGVNNMTKDFHKLQRQAVQHADDASFIANLLAAYSTPAELFDALFIEKIFDQKADPDANAKMQEKFRNALHTCGGATVAQINRALSAELEKRAPQSDLVELNLAPEAGDFRFNRLGEGRFKFKPKEHREALTGPVEYSFFTSHNYVGQSIDRLLNHQPIGIDVTFRLWPSGHDNLDWYNIIPGNFYWDNAGISADLAPQTETEQHLKAAAKVFRKYEQFYHRRAFWQSVDRLLQQQQQSEYDQKPLGTHSLNLSKENAWPFTQAYDNATALSKHGMARLKAHPWPALMAEQLHQLADLHPGLVFHYCLFWPSDGAIAAEYHALRAQFWRHLSQSGQRQAIEQYFEQLFSKTLHQDYRLHYHLDFVDGHWLDAKQAERFKRAWKSIDCDYAPYKQGHESAWSALLSGLR